MANQNINVGNQLLKIKKFDINNMCADPAIAMVAKRGSGKSWVCRDILRTLRNLPAGVIISPTDDVNPFYGKFFPDLYIHYKYKTEILQNLITRQEQMIEKAKQKEKEGKKIDPSALLLMDDCLASKGSWMKDELISRMFFNGRHYRITYILTMQFPLGISPELRNNFDYVFLLADDNVGNQKRLWEHYAGMFPTFDSFRQAFTAMTKNYGCMVICNRGSRDEITDKIFWYKASNESIKPIGCSQFNKFHREHYEKNYKAIARDKEKAACLDMANLLNRKKNVKVLKVEMVKADD